MNPQAVLILTWVTAGAVVALYIWFVVWRYRAERRKKAAQAKTDEAMSSAITRAAALADAAPSSAPAPPPAPSPLASSTTAGIGPRPEVVREPPVETPAAGDATVAAALSGISLPHDLAPLTTIADRPMVRDRVAFWTDHAPADIVGPAFADELERLGYTVSPTGERSLSAQRGATELLVMIHPEGRRAVIGDVIAFPSVPEMSVVIEVWIPG